MNSLFFHIFFFIIRSTAIFEADIRLRTAGSRRHEPDATARHASHTNMFSAGDGRWLTLRSVTASLGACSRRGTVGTGGSSARGKR